ncbi:DEAD/DEAH box helicase [Tieghemostelium lacteum]|uniref:RNA helicase n=1 Tax=Tieghemostelium lacteum TaxID=361077 RepID=A0A151ZJQ4_TIELA|nr:DEAD/DEAH box helicase [Tieghemostelium lacteum]|eukprot:KYQ94232.1 DEAD/DEAH box helicase [Tieghemostelium lacteum]
MLSTSASVKLKKKSQNNENIVNKHSKIPKQKSSSNGNTSKQVKSTNGSSAEKKYQVPPEIIEQKKMLPVYTAREALLKNFRENSSVIIISETGTGKTTQIPQYLYEDGYTQGGMTIAVTQPRRVAAVSIAKRVSQEMGVELGEKVGYTVRFDDKSSQLTRLKYLTDGMLVREAMIDPMLSKYSVIMLDEAHERTLNTDVLFGLLKSVQNKRKNLVKSNPNGKHKELKIIVMSATLDAELFSKYFNNAPVLYIEGRQFPVQIFYTEEVQKDYVDAALVTVLQIHLNTNKEDRSDEEQHGGDILVFLTGRDEIENLEKLLLERIVRFPSGVKKLLVCPIFSALPQEQQMKVFEKAPAGCRKVILATNIAETSLTINGIRHVVDTGVVKSKIYHSTIGIDSLSVIPISKASAKQRSGRAGREYDGKCYRLYTEDIFNRLEESSIAEIKRSNIANVILQLKTIGIDDVLSFDFLERPPIQTVKKSLELLYCLEALDDKGKLTEVGKKMSMFPLDPMYSKTLIKSVEFECLEEVLIIISMLSVESIFFIPKDKAKEVENIKNIFFSPEGDHITLLNVFREYQKVNGSPQWCYDHFINIKSMVKILNIFEQLVKYCMQSKMEMVSCQSDYERIRKCFITGFFLNVAVLQPDKKYKTMADNKEIQIHPSSFLFNVNPQYILFNELTITSKAFARNILPIEPMWLPEVCPKYYGRSPTVQDKSAQQSIKETTEAFKSN